MERRGWPGRTPAMTIMSFPESPETQSFSGQRTALIAFAILLMAAPARAGPPFVIDDPEPPELGRWEINSAFAGTLVHGGASASLPVIDANCGGAPGLQLHIQPQMAYIRTPKGAHYGFGDLEIGAKYRFIDEDENGWAPMVAIYPLFEIPTGDRGRALGTGVGRTFLPIWVQKTMGEWTVYGGGGYGINPGADGKKCLALRRRRALPVHREAPVRRRGLPADHAGAG